MVDLAGKKIVCVCAGGISRSYTLASLLKAKYGADAIAVGAHANGTDTLEMLFDWADVIMLTFKELMNDDFPEKWKSKAVMFDVGPDVYFRGLNPILVEKFEKYLADYLKEEGDQPKDQVIKDF